MDRGKDQVILVLQRNAGLAAGGVWRIKGQFGQEALARRIACRDLLQLQKVGPARLCVFVNAVEVGVVPSAGQADGIWPPCLGG